MELPNRVTHYYYHRAVELDMKSKLNPKGPEAKQMEGDAIADQLTGAI